MSIMVYKLNSLIVIAFAMFTGGMGAVELVLSGIRYPSPSLRLPALAII